MHWIKGLLSAAIGGAASSITVMIADPNNFNLADGWKKLATVAGVNALVSAAMYLKKSPIPEK
jgi:acyl-coenzyme A synthetase/AMP-(fatty) acid ligase